MLLPVVISVAVGVAEAATNATSRRLSGLTCPTGYYDRTDGNAYWWACGSDNPSAPFGSRGNCAGGAYTDIQCSCACVPVCETSGDCSAGQVCLEGRCTARDRLTICAEDASTWDAGNGPCSSYEGSNFAYCDSDFFAGYYAWQVCPQCGACVSVPYCDDASSRRRSGRSCSNLAADGHCSGGRRRTSGGEATDTCRKTCGRCGSLAGPAAACPSWKLAERGQTCSEACGAGNCLEDYYPTSYHDMQLVADLAGASCTYTYFDDYPESPCLYAGRSCYYSDARTDRCDVLSEYSLDQRFCCCKHDIGEFAAAETQTATTTVTTSTLTSTETTTRTFTLHPSSAYNINCTELSDSEADCATRIADNFPLDYCAVDANQQVCQQSCCGKAQAETIAGLPPQCGGLLDFWRDCEIRIDSFFRDCKDYCSIAGGCAFTCCVRENATDHVLSNLGLATEVNCSGNVTDYFQDCEVRIQDQRLNNIELCAVEHTRRGCEKTCCDQPAPAAVEGCEDLEDLWHDCDVRIWDRFLDGQDYCSHGASRCGCQLTCCKNNGRNGTEPGPILETGTNCSDPAVSDIATNCAVRLADSAGDGTSYCAVPARRAECEKTCCGLLDEPENTACEPDFQDTWPDCEQRIQDREGDGQDYCAIKFDREGCQRTCCGFGGEEVVETPITVECSGTEEDVEPDCETRIRDRFDDGLDYCNSGNPTDRENCARSCCLELGLPVVFTVTIQGLGELDSNTSSAILAAVAEEANVPESDVTIAALAPVGVARRLQTTDGVSAEISVSPPQGLPPQTVASRIEMGFTSALSHAIQESVPEAQRSAIEVTDMTRPLTAAVPSPTTTTTTAGAGPAPGPAPGPSPAGGEADVSGAVKSASYAGVLLASASALVS